MEQIGACHVKTPFRPYPRHYYSMQLGLKVRFSQSHVFSPSPTQPSPTTIIEKKFISRDDQKEKKKKKVPGPSRSKLL